MADDNSTALPQRQVDDYIEAGFLALAFAVGVPLNLYAFAALLRQYRFNARLKILDLKLVFLLQKLHLNVANVIILISFCPVKLFWLYTYQWVLGDFVCRLVHFLWIFSYNVSSYVIASIAFERLRTVLKLVKVVKGRGSSSLISGDKSILAPVKRMLAFSWLAGAAFAAPQLFIWKSVQLRDYWVQCVTCWNARRYHLDQLEKEFAAEKAYQVCHLLSVFWVPFLIGLVSYTGVIAMLLQYTYQPLSAAGAPQPLSSREPAECSSAQTSDTRPPRSVRARTLSEGTSSTALAMPAAHFATIHEDEGELTRRPSPPTRRLRTQSAVGRARKFSLVGRGVSLRRRQSVVAGTLPNWRLQMRSRMFRSTALVLIAYTLCWLPYQAISLLIFFDHSAYHRFNDQLFFYVFKNLILVNAVINPLLYSFRENN